MERWIGPFLAPHPLACMVASCRRPITAWVPGSSPTVGFCAEHAVRYCDWPGLITLTIHGEPGAGWCSYPEDVAAYVAHRR